MTRFILPPHRDVWTKEAAETSLEVKSAGLSGEFVHEETGQDIQFKEVDHFPGDKTVNAPEYWEIQGSDGQIYFINDSGAVTDQNDNEVGHFDPYASPYDGEAGEEQEGWYENWHGAKLADAEGFSIQGYLTGVGGRSSGMAIRTDIQSREEILAMIEQLQTPGQEHNEYIKEKNKERGTSFPIYDNPYVNRGAKTAEGPKYPEQFRGQGFILVSRWFTPNDNWIMYDERCAGIISEAGGLTSHAVVVARELNVPVLTDVLEANRIQPGDLIEMDGDTGIIRVNGGGDESELQLGPGQMAAAGKIAFIWYDGEMKTEDMEGRGGEEALHFAMMQQFMEERGFENVDPDGFGMGVIYEDGRAQLQGSPPDKEALIEQLHQLGAIEISDFAGQAAYAPVMASAKYAFLPALGLLARGLMSAGSGAMSALQGGNLAGLGSQVLRTGVGMNILQPDHPVQQQIDNLPDDQLDELFGMLQGQMAPVARVAADGKYTKGQRVEITHPKYKGQHGSILECGGKHEHLEEEKYKILLDNGEELNDMLESHFKKIKSASFEEVDTPAEHFLDSMGVKEGASWGQGDYFSDDPYVSPNRQRRPRYETDNPEIPLDRFDWTCPECGADQSYLEDDDRGTADCTNCGAIISIEDLKYPEYPERIGSLQKGSPYPGHHDEDKSHDKEHMKGAPEKVNEIYHAIRRDNPDISKEQAAKMAWAKYKEMKGKKSGWRLATAAILDSNGHPLEPGHWYVMHSTEYRVPDVLQVLNYFDNRVEAAIEGDNKGHFPITIDESEVKKMGYTFEPYHQSETPALEELAKESRKKFSPTQQSSLINENLGARARNFDKLNLDGTHYPSSLELNDDILAHDFLW